MINRLNQGCPSNDRACKSFPRFTSFARNKMPLMEYKYMKGIDANISQGSHHLQPLMEYKYLQQAPHHLELLPV